MYAYFSAWDSNISKGIKFDIILLCNRFEGYKTVLSLILDNWIIKKKVDNRILINV